jgi:hypothetical protein
MILKSLLIHYHKQKTLTWLALFNVLRIANYDKIQKFKTEVKSN